MRLLIILHRKKQPYRNHTENPRITCRKRRLVVEIVNKSVVHSMGWPLRLGVWGHRVSEGNWKLYHCVSIRALPIPIRLLIYPADVVFVQLRHWPSLFLWHASGQLVIVLFRQLHHGHGTLLRRKSRRGEHYQHLNLNWRHVCSLFLFLMFSFLCTVTAVLCTIHFKFFTTYYYYSLVQTLAVGRII